MFILASYASSAGLHNSKINHNKFDEPVQYVEHFYRVEWNDVELADTRFMNDKWMDLT